MTNKTVNNSSKMMTMNKKMMMNSNKVVVTMTNSKMMTKMDPVMMTNNNKVQVKTNSSNQSKSRKIKSCLHLKWLSVNNLNSLNLLLYLVKFLTCHVLLITLLGLYILLLSQVCRGGRMEVVMALRISFIKLGWKILKCLSHKDNRALLSWKTMMLKLIWNLKLLSNLQNLLNKILLYKQNLIKYQLKAKNSSLNFIKKIKSLKDGK